MRERNKVFRLVVILGTATVALAVSAIGCTRAERGMMHGDGSVDGAGMTNVQAVASLEEQFERVRERDARMQELMTEAQLQISPGVWRWGQKGGAPILGENTWSVPGMSTENSYHLHMWRSIRLEKATGIREDLNPMVEYFRDQGWVHWMFSSPHGQRHSVQAETSDGYLLRWDVQANGQYNMRVSSKTFWGDSRELLFEIEGRTPDAALDIEESVPGVYVPFPEWDDPIVYVPDLLDHSGKGE